MHGIATHQMLLQCCSGGQSLQQAHIHRVLHPDRSWTLYCHPAHGGYARLQRVQEHLQAWTSVSASLQGPQCRQLPDCWADWQAQAAKERHVSAESCHCVSCLVVTLKIDGAETLTL